MVRFSRLIGNFDTTSRRVALQVVEDAGGRYECNFRRIYVRRWLQCYVKKRLVFLPLQSRPQKHETPPGRGWRFMSVRWSLASQQIVGSGWIHRTCAGSLDRSAASLAAALAECLLLLRASRNLPSSRYITGTL